MNIHSGVDWFAGVCLISGSIMAVFGTLLHVSVTYGLPTKVRKSNVILTTFASIITILLLSTTLWWWFR